MAKKIITIEPNSAVYLSQDPGGLPPTYARTTTGFSIRVGYAETTIGIVEYSFKDFCSYEWTFTSNWKTGAGISGTVTVDGAYLEFYYSDADNPLFLPSFDIVSLASSPANAASAQAGWDLINNSTNIVSTVTTARGDKKNKIRVEIDDASALATAINTPGGYYLGLKTSVDRDQYLNVGGNYLAYGTDTLWTQAGANEIKGKPKLIITLKVDDESHVEHDLRYTTSDPTSDQNTPSNSIGGYVAPNEVFTTAQISEPLGLTDNTLTIDSSSSFPSSVGIVQIGPEIINFAGISTSERQLNNLTRGVVPLSVKFPAAIDQFEEYIRYLEVDNLFDKKPSSELEQYRCIAVLQASSSSLNNVKVYLIQNPLNDVQIDIGIEVPAFDATSGTATAAISSGATTFSSVSSVVRNQGTGYYNGGHIIIDPSSTAFEAIIDSYDDDGSAATFILDRAMPAFGSAPSFRINPAPSQTVQNEKTKPTNNSGRFLGFLGEGGERSIGFDSIREHGGLMRQYDAFYVWIKRTLVKNKKSKNDTGAVIIIEGSQ